MKQQHALLSRPQLPRQMGGHTLPPDQTDQVASLVISKKQAKNLTIDRNSHSTVTLSSQNLLKRASNLCKKSHSNSRKNQTNSSLDRNDYPSKKGLSHLANSQVSKSGILNSKKIDHSYKE